MHRSTPPGITRRSLLATVGSGTGATIAGCLGRNPAEPDDSTADDSGSEEAPPDFPDHPGDAPIDPPEGRRCDGPCGMTPAAHPESNAQIAHEGGEGAFFDSVGCLVAYRHDPTFYDGPQSPVGRVWVRDFGTEELIDADGAVFVHDYDKDRHEETMAHNPKPFADRNDAVAYVDSHDDLAEDTIVDLDFFGAEEAHGYRNYPIPDDD